MFAATALVYAVSHLPQEWRTCASEALHLGPRA
jgi:hypothetical protein